MLAVAVLARRPVTGGALLELVPPLAAAEAARLARAFLEDTLRAVRDHVPAHVRKVLAYAPRDADAWFDSVLSSVGGGFDRWAQPDGAADERLGAALQALYDGGAAAALAVTAEAPELPGRLLVQAVDALAAGADVVVGPCGATFWALGLSRKAYDALDGEPTEAACRAAGLSRRELPAVPAVAMVSDLERLLAELSRDRTIAPATRATLQSLGKLARD